MADALSGAASHTDKSAVTVHACAAGANLAGEATAAPTITIVPDVVDTGAATPVNAAAGSKYQERNFAQAISGSGQNAGLPGANRPPGEQVS